MSANSPSRMPFSVAAISLAQPRNLSQLPKRAQEVTSREFPVKRRRLREIEDSINPEPGDPRASTTPIPIKSGGKRKTHILQSVLQSESQLMTPEPSQAGSSQFDSSSSFGGRGHGKPSNDEPDDLIPDSGLCITSVTRDPRPIKTQMTMLSCKTQISNKLKVLITTKVNSVLARRADWQPDDVSCGSDTSTSQISYHGSANFRETLQRNIRRHLSIAY
jgi:hypothetical protein